MEVWVALTRYRGDPRWDDDGQPIYEDFIEGVASDADVAKAFATTCSNRTIRWFKNPQGNWVACDRWRKWPAEVHFHLAQRWTIHDSIDANGWPRHG